MLHLVAEKELKEGLAVLAGLWREEQARAALGWAFRRQAATCREQKEVEEAMGALADASAQP